MGPDPSALAKGDISGAGLSEKAINHLKNLSDFVGKHKNGKGVNLWVKKRPAGIGVGIVKNIREDWESDYYDFGTVEGRLEAIQDSAGALKIRIEDFLYLKAINCIVPERMIDDVLGSFRKRVEVEGRIHYRRDGTPISIEADVIDILPEDADLPTADDVRGDCCISCLRPVERLVGALGHAVSNSCAMNWSSPATPDFL